MTEHTPPPAAGPRIDFKDPVIAGFLAWLIPGLGHFYQGRYPKAVLCFLCILGTFCYGLYLGSGPEIGWARVVYLSFRENDLRLPYLCQVGIGLPTLPALIQANRVYSGKPPLFHGFMAPPLLKADPNQPAEQTVQELYRSQPRLFELGTVYTMIAGLLNILMIYDACCGPVPVEPAKKRDEEDPKSGEGKAEKKPS